ncbi:hypothetical protein V8C42DRAFT_185027 [Trichoderma barbatum]
MGHMGVSDFIIIGIFFFHFAAFFFLINTSFIWELFFFLSSFQLLGAKHSDQNIPGHLVAGKICILSISSWKGNAVLDSEPVPLSLMTLLLFPSLSLSVHESWILGSGLRFETHNHRYLLGIIPAQCHLGCAFSSPFFFFGSMVLDIPTTVHWNT